MKLSLYTKVRLFFHLEREPYLCFLYTLLGFFPDNINLYRLAFQHKSNQVTQGSHKLRSSDNNERLEFLGDAVLDAIIADIVYHNFPNHKEGFLTNTRSKIVQRDTMNKIAVQLGLHGFLSIPQNGTCHSNNIYGNALEALIGAIYLDRGYAKCKQFVERKIIKSHLDLSKIARKEINFKSILIEWGQKNKISVSFKLIDTVVNAENSSIFQTEVLVGNKIAGLGIGATKKESQQNAAKIAVSKIRKNKEFNHYLSSLREQQKGDSFDDNKAERDNFSKILTTELMCHD